MIKSKIDKEHKGCNVVISGTQMELTNELASIFESFSENIESEVILLSVIDTYISNHS